VGKFPFKFSILSGGLLWGACWPLCGQFEVAKRPVEIHGFFTQGFLYSNQNNYLTAPTARGSFAFTDGGLNFSTQISPRLRVGAQAYSRNLGELGKGRVMIDWAVAEYSVRDWLVVRAGKVKTAYGLYGQTQDVGSVHTWALLPQSIYSLDLRGSFISHIGVDLSGSLSSAKYGTLSYTAYSGLMPKDWTGGFVYQLEENAKVTRLYGNLFGFDVRWNSASNRFTAGTSYMDLNQNFDLSIAGFPLVPKVRGDRHSAIVFAQYAPRRLRLDAELSWQPTRATLQNVGYIGRVQADYQDLSWYVSAAYRLNRILEVGSYYSTFRPDPSQGIVALSPSEAAQVPPSASGQGAGFATSPSYDLALTARLDFTRHWNLKVEGHRMDGTGSTISFRGFYDRANPQGLQRRTNLLVLRLGFQW
jgi:hypothetical protein